MKSDTYCRKINYKNAFEITKPSFCRQDYSKCFGQCSFTEHQDGKALLLNVACVRRKADNFPELRKAAKQKDPTSIWTFLKYQLFQNSPSQRKQSWQDVIFVFFNVIYRRYFQILVLTLNCKITNKKYSFYIFKLLLGLCHLFYFFNNLFFNRLCTCMFNKWAFL